MKKILVFVLVVSMLLLAIVACGEKTPQETSSESTSETTEKVTETETETTPPDDHPAVEVMNHAAYVAAEADAPVAFEAYVQGKQIYSAQYGNTSLYLQDSDGGYFVYRWACTQEEYDALAIGTKVRVTGFKAIWAGEHEVAEKTATVEVLSDTFVAEPLDVTAYLGTADIEKYQNMLVVFKGMTVEAYDDDGNAFAYKSEDGSDIYYKVSYNGTTYNFCVESDLCGAGTEAYEAVKALKVGDVVDITGFLYWYNGLNPHTTGVAKVTAHSKYVAAEADDPVAFEAYVQGKQIYSAQYGSTSLYLQDSDGGYFVYRWACTQEEYDALAIGTKVRVTGFKAIWAGEHEVAEKTATVEVLSDTFVAEPLDVTAYLGTADIEKYQNMLVVFKGMTVEAYDDDGNAFAYKSEDGSDIYYKVSYNGTTYNFCVESDLCGAGTEAYEAVKALKVGDVVDITGFLYWYNGINPHTTGVKAAS